MKRWILKISFSGSIDWDIVEEFKSFIICISFARQLDDDSVVSMVIEDKVTGNIIFPIENNKLK